MADVYILYLTGQGDTSIKVVDLETFDWVTSNNPGVPAGVNPRETGCWDDTLVPQCQKDLRIKMDPDDLDPVNISIGSWENDRALFAYALERYDRNYYSLKEVMAAIRSNKDKLEDEYHGCIY